MSTDQLLLPSVSPQNLHNVDLSSFQNRQLGKDLRRCILLWNPRADSEAHYFLFEITLASAYLVRFLIQWSLEMSRWCMWQCHGLLLPWINLSRQHQISFPVSLCRIRKECDLVFLRQLSLELLKNHFLLCNVGRGFACMVKVIFIHWVLDWTIHRTKESACDEYCSRRIRWSRSFHHRLHWTLFRRSHQQLHFLLLCAGVACCAA